jgi:hypothetical protein
MTPRTPQGEVFCPLLSNSKDSGVPGTPNPQLWECEFHPHTWPKWGCDTFGAKTSHGQIRIHKTHHGPDLREATTFPLIVYSVSLHEAHIQMTFCLGLPLESFEIPKIGTFVTLWFLQLCEAITSCADLRLGWSLKKSYSPRQELSNGMSHATFTQGNWGDSKLLVVGSQTTSLTPDLSFGHNLCFKCPNESCEPTLDIYVPRVFQWYKELFNITGFDLYNRSLKIWESTETPTPNMGAHLGVWVFILSHSPIFSTSQEHEMWLSGFYLSLHPCKPLPWSRAQG